MTTYQVIGKPTPRVEGVDKVTGRARYAADVPIAGTLWGKTLASPYAHARIVSIDTSAAKALPGVYAVLTGADVRDGMYGRAIKDIPVLAYEKVRFAGERVVAVAADDEDIAQRALALIDVEYEELPAVYDIFEALEDGAPVLHPDFASYTGGAELEKPTNGYNHTSTGKGDIEQGFADADLIVENTYETSRVHQAYLEPQSVLVNIEGDRVQVWTCSKAPYNTREALAVAAGLPVEQIVFNHTYIGGDFGGKATPASLPIAYQLAKATGRPVRMVHDYVEELMAGNPRHSTVVKLRSGVKNDGTLTAHQVLFYVNVGGYAGYKPGRVIGGAAQAAGPYRVPNTLIEQTHVYTNIVPGGHMRAPGYPQGIFALESHIDELAKAVGMDPLDFRLRNLVEEGETPASGHGYHNVRAKETLRAAAEAAGYSLPKAPNVGRGLAVGDHAPGQGQGTASVTLRPDGTIVLGTPIFDQGTGTYTTLTQIVAEELQVPIERISLDIWTTEALPNDSGIGGSRGTRVATAVAYAAAQDAKQELLKHVGRRLEWPGDQLSLAGGQVQRADTNESVAWPEVLSATGESVEGRANVQESGSADETSFAAQVAEVEVDPETGEVKLRRFVTAHDVGQIMNPIGHQGQINGGFSQGLGYALMEELRIEDGRVTNVSFGDYKIPTIADMPPLETVLLESEEGVGPYNIRGIGENANPPVAPAIANAVADATGVRIRDLPITAEKVYRGLKQR